MPAVAGSSGKSAKRSTPPAVAAEERAARLNSRNSQSSAGKDVDVLSEAAARKRVSPATSPPSSPKAQRVKNHARRIPDSSEEDELSTAGAVETVEARGGKKLKAAGSIPKVQ
jgi:hypothetical protein